MIPKFRFWNKRNNTMYKKLDFIGFSNGNCDIGLWEDGIPMIIHVGADAALLQAVGLSDKHDVDIYEGDILKIISSKYGIETISEVVWGLTSPDFGNYPAFCITEIESELNSFAEVFDSGDYEVEVIGNIYENPDLLAKDVEGME